MPVKSVIMLQLQCICYTMKPDEIAQYADIQCECKITSRTYKNTKNTYQFTNNAKALIFCIYPEVDFI